MSKTMDKIVNEMRRLGVTMPGDDGEASDGTELEDGGQGYHSDAMET